MTHLHRLLGHVIKGQSLTYDDAYLLFRMIVMGAVNPPQVAAFLVALRMNGETPDEVAGAVDALRSKALPVRIAQPVLDCCGTGGDGLSTPNISTAVGCVVAACGVPVAKHGGRSVSSSSGSADVLEAMGAVLSWDTTRAQEFIDATGFIFLFAPHVHPSLHHLSTVRKILGVRTLGNLLGPLLNPAAPTYQLLGVYDPQWLTPMAQSLAKLGVQRFWVVCGDDGMDELSIYGASQAVMYQDGSYTYRRITPDMAGLAVYPAGTMRGGDASFNAQCMRKLFASYDTCISPELCAYRDAEMLNAAAALCIAGASSTLEEGAARARSAMQSGAAYTTMMTFITTSQHYAGHPQ